MNDIQWLDRKYIALLGSSLPLFKRRGNDTWNYRCVICGDSKTNKTKARGYILNRSGKFFSYCHNCHASFTFSKFLERINPYLYGEYIKERFQDNPSKPERRVTVPKVLTRTENNKVLLGLQKMSLLDANHKAKKFIVSRQIPSYYHSRLYWAPNFNKFANTLVPDKYDPELKEGRIVIPMLDKSRKLIGFQGRSLNSKGLRYITVMLSEDNPKLFGLDMVDFSKRFFVVEGPIDSMFINNSIAVCGGSIHTELEKQGIPKPLATIVYDNEPRNAAIVKAMEKSIKANYSVCIWPKGLTHKDINDIVLSKVTGEYVKTEEVQKVGLAIEKMILDNSYSGLEAELELSKWSKL